MAEASFHAINYSLRPAKSIERKMILETFGRLGSLHPLTAYQYVGFGSVWFSDFIAIHRTLGINHMVSIEREHDYEPRFYFNRPYNCVDLQFGDSSDKLPELDWDRPTLCWLDYDDQIAKYMFDDAAIFFTKAPPGSMFLVSANVDLRGSKDRIADFSALVGERNVQAGLTNEALMGWKITSAVRWALMATIQEGLRIRNGVVDFEDELQYKQLFYFHYKDGARMATFGGLLHSQRQKAAVDVCGFDSLSFVRTGSTAYLINVPPLTRRELRYLDSMMPTSRSHADITKEMGISQSDVEQYSNIYRYFPFFSETEL